MDQRKMEKFRVIGACARMQTTSWEEEIKLVDGIPYFIDFSQDFSKICLNDHPIENMSINDIIKSINPQTEVCTTTSYTPSGEDYKRSQKFWEDFNKSEKRRKEQEEKWEKKWKKTKRKEKEKPSNCLKILTVVCTLWIGGK